MAQAATTASVFPSPAPDPRDRRGKGNRHKGTKWGEKTTQTLVVVFSNVKS